MFHNTRNLFDCNSLPRSSFAHALPSPTPPQEDKTSHGNKLWYTSKQERGLFIIYLFDRLISTTRCFRRQNWKKDIASDVVYGLLRVIQFCNALEIYWIRNCVCRPDIPDSGIKAQVTYDYQTRSLTYFYSRTTRSTAVCQSRWSPFADRIAGWVVWWILSFVCHSWKTRGSHNASGSGSRTWRRESQACHASTCWNCELDLRKERKECNIMPTWWVIDYFISQGKYNSLSTLV